MRSQSVDEGGGSEDLVTAAHLQATNIRTSTNPRRIEPCRRLDLPHGDIQIHYIHCNYVTSYTIFKTSAFSSTTHTRLAVSEILIIIPSPSSPSLSLPPLPAQLGPTHLSQPNHSNRSTCRTSRARLSSRRWRGGGAHGIRCTEL